MPVSRAQIMLAVMSEAEYAVSDAEHWALVMVFTSTFIECIQVRTSDTYMD